MINETVGNYQENSEQRYAFQDCRKFAIATDRQSSYGLDKKEHPAEQKG